MNPSFKANPHMDHELASHWKFRYIVATPRYGIAPEDKPHFTLYQSAVMQRGNEPMIKVAIVEDDSRFRESLAILIDGSPEFRCIGTYANAGEALKQLPRDWPDVVLMDINLPEMSGIECVAKLKEIKPALQVMMLTVYMDSEQVFNSLKAGASGYLLKKTSPAKILEAISEVHAGGSPMSGAVARRVVQTFQVRKSPDETKNLSKREHEILALLAKGNQDKEIAELLGLSVFTVRTHIKSIYEKLHVRSRTEAVVKFLKT